MASEPGKRPMKGILKHTSSLDKASRREVEWDEMNILATHHPPGKDYGHMKIDEPSTPYNKYSDTEDDDHDEGLERRGSSGNLKEPPLDASQLASRLASAEDAPHKSAHVEVEEGESSEEDENETDEERAQRKQFELKRKRHYNEFAAVQLAKKLMAEEDDDDDNGADNTEMTPASDADIVPSTITTPTRPTSEAMETGNGGPPPASDSSQAGE